MISNVTSSVAPNAPIAYQPVNRQTVGQESSDLKSSNFRATEQGAESARQQNKRSPGDNPTLDAEQSRVTERRAQPVDERQSRQQRAQKEQRENEQQLIEKLSSRDREVRAHEQAHAAVGGKYAGSPTYTYQRGPDGASYAVGGEVPIDTSSIPNDPEATLRKAEQIARAASAPADPSGQDRAVASQAAKLAQQARVEIIQKIREKSIENKPDQQDKSDDKQVRLDSQSQRSEDSAKVEKQKADEKLLKEEQRAQSEREAARTQIFAEIQKKNAKANRRLLEINSFEKTSTVGRLLDKSV